MPFAAGKSVRNPGTLTFILGLLVSCDTGDPEIDTLLDKYEAVLVRAENAHRAGEISQLQPLVSEIHNYNLDFVSIIQAGTFSSAQNSRLEALYNRFIILLQ
jgi:hypothetical protein